VTQTFPACWSCLHLVRTADGVPTQECPAYPSGIPVEVMLSKRPHTEVLDDQQGVLIYTPSTPDAPKVPQGPQPLPGDKEFS